MKQVAAYLELVLTIDGDDFIYWHDYFVPNCANLNIPHDFSEEDVLNARNDFDELFEQKYPGKILGKDITFEELSEDVKIAYTVYNHEYYLLLFEQAKERFNLAWVEFIVPVEELPDNSMNVMYALDCLRDERIVDGNKYIQLGITVNHKIAEHKNEYEAWTTGETAKDFDVFDNEFGHDYALYKPLFINGRKLGLIGVEIDIPKLQKVILMQTLKMMLFIALILITAVVLLLFYIYKKYIFKLSSLKNNVRLYSEGKNAEIATAIEKNANGKDEISVLSMQVSSMIMELENYMRSLLETAKELRDTQQKADAMNELAIKDALTGIRNKTAYDTEVQNMDWLIAQGKAEFSIAMIDLNYLKRINDSFGHEQGNIAIKKLCYIVCHTFTHSPVFRIGGDEFVVIIKNDDYKNRLQLVKDFNITLEALEKDVKLEVWEKISAAIGMADFDKTIDANVANVFARADKAMYQRKKEMKAVRES